ncbi:E3 ubiquitin-protein ligase sina [Orchesella cincta]|uniref:E3 ubiquitin-protein ligase sina n=1 Tax=Orchesella cincta TaxID=48709 RepID=A0A1D2MRY4_ORCCI|nr:E3 ubiquitin-protein ligase sina [Orchesella cincta]
MSAITGSIPSRLQEEIRIFNLSLPINPFEAGILECDFEPELANLLRAVECPICRCIPNPPIYNCVNGHFSCSSCLPRLHSKRCAYCLANFTKMRNYPLENLVASRVFLCDFRNAGCKAKDMNMSEYEEHMRMCWFRSTFTSTKQPKTADKDEEVVSCPRCSFRQSKRKLKCQNCQINLRTPTPMCSRPSWVQAGNSNPRSITNINNDSS